MYLFLFVTLYELLDYFSNRSMLGLFALDNTSLQLQLALFSFLEAL